MDIRRRMETFAEWVAAANANGNLFTNGVQNQALSLTTSSTNSIQNSISENSHNSGKTLSVRCIVESVPDIQYWETPFNNHGQVEVDRKAVVPVQTVFYNLLESVLRSFGYPKETATTAKGSIIIENWKPIKLEKVAQNPQKTVNDILGHISSFVTLKIQILRTSSCANAVLTQMKEKLLQLLILQNREHILSSGCPLDQVTLKSILRGSDYNAPSPSDEVVRKFEHWIANQYRQALRPIPYSGPITPFSFHLGSTAPLHHEKTHLPPASPEDRVHPALQTVQNQYPTQKTRMRTSFDPELELPKLQKWFSDNQHPSRQQIQQYVSELNNLESRRGRKPLDVNNVVYWFKNARAAQKRAEVRNLTPGILGSLNGYRSDSHSPCETAVTSKESAGSVHSSDSESEDNGSDVDEEPSSPVTAPLSLTYKDKTPTPTPEVKQEPPDKDSPASTDSKEKPKDEPNSADTSDSDLSDTESKSESRFRSSPLMVPRNVFPLVPNSMFNHGFNMFGMAPYMPTMNMVRSPVPASTYSDDRRKRNRTFIDPVTEVPCLERWFCMNTHPSHGLILQYTEDLNSMPYRQKFPRLEPKNVQFWFKNRRAKCKRLKSSLYDNNNLSPQEQYHQLAAALSGEGYRSQE